jgi:hypothetical protein
MFKPLRKLSELRFVVFLIFLMVKKMCFFVFVSKKNDNTPGLVSQNSNTNSPKRERDFLFKQQQDYVRSKKRR